jgi:hypothetical protein
VHAKLFEEVPAVPLDVDGLVFGVCGFDDLVDQSECVISAGSAIPLMN